MVFSSAVFVFLFLPITLLLYYVTPYRFKNGILLFCSLLFYAWGEPVNVLVMLASIAVNYKLGRMLGEKRPKRQRKKILLLAIVVDMGLLFYFKYFNFFVDTANHLLPFNITVAKVALPIGISFYTFQIMSYVIDVYRRDVKARRSFVDLALYISLFPQLIAGPIVRYVDIRRQLRHRSVTADKLYSGLMSFMKGFSKKVLIADQLAPLADAAFSNIGKSALLSWAGIAAYTLQIYYDFSGYSDMAIGLGRMFGFEFMENFNFPYISKSIQEFWRRWHISLSTWFRDYVYIPLGGNRRGTARTYINLIIVFLATGFWHGASFNFIVWGAYYGIFLIIERVGFGNTLKKAKPVLPHCYTLLVVIIGWVFFRADTLKDAVLYIKSMFVFSGTDWAGLISCMKIRELMLIIAGAVLACPHVRIRNRLEAISAGEALMSGTLLVVFLIALCYMTGTGFSPFLYFRF